MNVKTAMKLPLLALTAALALTGCGNEADQGAVLTALKGSLPSLGKKAAAPAAPDPAPVLKNTSVPVSMIVQSTLGGITAVIVQIEQNGPYRTYTTASRQTLTFRQGLVTATRGLGNDMMSASVSDSLALISARKPGTAKRVLRYLDGANNVITYQFDCEMYMTGAARVQQGEVSANAVEMTENCFGRTQKFTNTYLVDGSGMILSSQQWISPIQGYFDIKVLRR